MSRALRLAAVAAALCGCSPVYVYKAAAGHTKLLLHRRGIEKSLRDPRTPAELRPGLALTLEARAFAFDRLQLSRSRAYTTWSPVKGEALTWLVSASSRTALASYVFRFPLVGSFPYKGYFAKADALAEKERLEREGWDAAVSGAAAYKTPLWISDPLPSPVLSYPPGELAALIIHELTHGTVFFKDRVEFNETLAEFVGQAGAREFLAKRYGEASRELADYRSALERQKNVSAAFDEIYGRLDALYKSSATLEAKLAAREPVFAWGLARLKDAGADYGRLNNAVVLAHRVYHDEGDRAALQDALGRFQGDWGAFLKMLRGLDPKDPSGDLRRRYSPRGG